MRLSPQLRPTVLRKAAAALLMALLGAALLSGPFAAGAASLLSLTQGLAAEPVKVDGPEVVMATEIPVRADMDERFAQQVVLRARQKDPTSELVPRLDQLAAGVRKLSTIFRKEEINHLQVMRLESLESHWNFYNRELEAWRRDLQRVTSAYSEDAAALSTRRAAWEATRAVSGLAPALAARANVIAAQFAAAERAISGPLDEQLKLGRRANTLQASIDAGRKAVGAAITYFDRRLTTIDVPPLWEVLADPDYANDDAVAAAKVGLAIENDFLGEYVDAHRGRLLLGALLGIVLLPILLWLALRSRKLVADDPALKSSAHVLVRPVSAWLVVTLVSVPFVLPDAPLSVHQAALFLALIPVLRLLPREVYDLFGAGPYVVTGLYLLYRLGVGFIAHDLFFRLHLMTVSMLALVALVWVLWRRPTRALPDAPSAVVSTWRAIGYAAVVGLIVAIVCNLIGNVSLATVLTGGVVASAYVGLALHAGASVVTSLVRLLLGRKPVTRLRVVTQRTGPLLHALSRLVKLGAVLIWIGVTLDVFRVYRPVMGGVTALLAYSIEAGHLSVTVGSILLFGLSVWIALWFARSIRAVLHDDVLPRMSLPRGVGNSISTLSYYALVTIGVLVALAAAGFETSQFAIVLGALGVGIGFGLQGVVNNFVSGLILMFERPIQPGDVVEVSGTSGTVREIGMRATTLTTFDGADVVVPNGTLLSEKLINWTLSDMNRRIDVDVGVAYGSDPKRVMELLGEIAAGTPGVVPDPEPAVVFLRFGASSLDFAIRAWTNDFGDWVAIRSRLTVRIYESLRAEGIEIPLPQQDLHLRSVSPEASAQLWGRKRGGTARQEAVDSPGTMDL